VNVAGMGVVLKVVHIKSRYIPGNERELIARKISRRQAVDTHSSWVKAWYSGRCNSSSRANTLSRAQSGASLQ
jgi:hypothetical protein